MFLTSFFFVLLTFASVTYSRNSFYSNDAFIYFKKINLIYYIKFTLRIQK